MINIKTMMRNHHFTRKKMVKLRENHINSIKEENKKMSKKFLNLEEQHEVIRTKIANWQELRSDLEVLRKKLDF